MKTTWTFDTGTSGFTYLDDVFDFTAQPKYAGGSRPANGGYTGGALLVKLGGVDNLDVSGMSGAWLKEVTFDQAQSAKLTFRYKIDQGAHYEPNEYSEVRVAVDDGTDFVARISGDGNGGSNRTSGWKTVTIDLGTLEAGAHTLKLGGFNNHKDSAKERTKIYFDDVTLKTTQVSAPPGGGTPPPGSPALEAFEARVLELTNAFRVENGKAPLANDAKLNAAAEDWSHAMADGDFFRHSTPAQVEAQGYDWRAWGENIAAGYQTPESVVQGWIKSSGHRANMLSDTFKEIGVGYYYLATDTGSVNYHHYWTQTFGTEKGDYLV